MARAIEKADVMVGFADLYTAPANTAKPADSVPYNGTFTNFASVGATEDGVTVAFAKETTEHRIEEDPLPALVMLASATFTLTLSLAEDTMETLALAYGGTITAGTGKRTLMLSDEVEELAILFEAKTPDGGHRRMHIPRVGRTGEVSTPYRRAESKRLYPVTFQSLSRLGEIDIAEFPAAA